MKCILNNTSWKLEAFDFLAFYIKYNVSFYTLTDRHAYDLFYCTDIYNRLVFI